MKTIGILALQGDTLEHFNALRKIKNIKPTFIKTNKQLSQKLHGLIIPGGESTVIGKMMKKYKLDLAIKDKYKTKKMGIYGTCAGCILIAKQVDSEYSLKLIDIQVQRNAYGRQAESFMTDLNSSLFKIKGIFIRAPKIIKTLNSEVNVLAKHNDEPVLVQQNNILAGTFHPELTDKVQIHQYFVDHCC
ncbi:MAG: pyridoxal 5'-phosphate synthase glutaminase subunit PdxT [Patescibacteria group bacterium]